MIYSSILETSLVETSENFLLSEPRGIQTEFQEGFSHVLASKMLPRYSKSKIRSDLKPG